MNTFNTDQRRSIIETALVLLLLLILLSSLYTVLSIFLGVFTYAIILAVAIHPLFEKLARLLGGKRKLAAFIYALILIAIVALPFVYLINELASLIQGSQAYIADAKANGLQPLPEWIAGLPVVGENISSSWQKLQNDPSAIHLYEPKIRAVLTRLLGGGLGVVGAGFELVLGIIISAIFLNSGTKILNPIYVVMKRMVGENDGPALVDASGRAVKGVAIGVMGTAFIAGIAAWIGFAIAGIPIAAGLAAITFFFVVIQIGPLLVFLPVCIWLGMQGETGMAVFMTIYGIVVLMGIDNVLKPILIAKSGKLPILVLFLGVIGGMTTWGFTGMFKGAIILAVFYTLFNSWLKPKTQVAV
ncbi:MAG TPA: AI-2E family transporter [Chitinophagaceae bacterium]